MHPAKALRAIRQQIDELLSEVGDEVHAPAFPLTLAAPTLKKGERYVGTIISADGAKREHIILLPGDVEGKTWGDAQEWAASIGGELPDRCEGALLFATLKSEFKEEWYWTREQHASYSSYAWMQHFLDGSQSNYDKDYHCRARAVRRLIIQ